MNFDSTFLNSNPYQLYIMFATSNSLIINSPLNSTQAELQFLPVVAPLFHPSFHLPNIQVPLFLLFISLIFPAPPSFLLAFLRWPSEGVWSPLRSSIYDVLPLHIWGNLEFICVSQENINELHRRGSEVLKQFSCNEASSRGRGGHSGTLKPWITFEWERIMRRQESCFICIRWY